MCIRDSGCSVEWLDTKFGITEHFFLSTAPYQFLSFNNRKSFLVLLGNKHFLLGTVTVKIHAHFSLLSLLTNTTRETALISTRFTLNAYVSTEVTIMSIPHRPANEIDDKNQCCGMRDSICLQLVGYRQNKEPVSYTHLDVYKRQL